MPIAMVGIDLGKNSCSLAALDASGGVGQRRRMRPENIAAFTKKLPACVMSDGGVLWCSPSWPAPSRTRSSGLADVQEYVRTYVKAQKNDDRDAEACALLTSRLRHNLPCKCCIACGIGSLASERC